MIENTPKFMGSLKKRSDVRCFSTFPASHKFSSISNLFIKQTLSDDPILLEKRIY